MSVPEDDPTHRKEPTHVDRRRAVVLAGHLGDAETARAGLADPDPDVRGAALGALDRLGELGPAQISAGLRDPDPRTRRRAALVAARRQDTPADLQALLDDPDPLVVEAAAFACGERPDASPEMVGRLARLAEGHEDSLCREAAVAALGAIGDPGGLAAVLVACADRATVRRRAVLALAAFDGQEVTEMLRHMTTDRDLQVRQAAEELLAIELGEEL